MRVVMETIAPRPATLRQPAHLPDDLLERDHELATLRRCLRNARDTGAGSVLFVEAPAGGGKSRLLDAARDIAGDARMRVLTAAGVEFEREFPFALAMRLLGRPSPSAAGQDRFSAIHDLFQAVKDIVDADSADQQRAADEQPARGEHAAGLVILVDDVHWADPSSLGFLAYLAERIADLPIAMVLAAATGEPSADPRALAMLRRAAGNRLLPLARLSADGVARAVRRRFAHAEEELCASCEQTSGGNPFLLTELLRAMAEDEQAPPGVEASHKTVAQIVPDAVRDSISARLDAMLPAMRAVAEAVAVLDEGATVARVSRLAELDSEVVLLAADRLAAMGLLAPGIPLVFAQPMLGTAIRVSLAPFERAQAHLRAARILVEQHADAEMIAEHLLEAPADHDPATVELLCEAARAALRRGQPERSTLLLDRALAEDPVGGLRVQVEAELDAARAYGLVMADDLEGALEICDRALAAGAEECSASGHEQIECIRAWALYEQGRLPEAQAAATATLECAVDDGRHAQGAQAVLARCHLEQGDLVQAESVIAAMEGRRSGDSLLRALVFDVRAQLRLVQHRPQEALGDALHAGALLGEQLSDAHSRSIAWRSSAALAHLALGEPQPARRLVGRELEESQTTGVTRTVIRDLRILGLALGAEPDGMEKLAEAVAIGASHPNRLEYVRALIDYGAALRRAGRRVDAREPLREALDLSHRGGAAGLESRARAELIAAGARPRRAALTGPASLTTSQRRVAELAAGGLTTRQIAAALFVTPKTVEFHLRHIYAKLEVSSREELTRELSATGPLPAAPGSGA